MSLATGRERRQNAGAKMTKLLNEEEDEDEFYKTAYGGFEEQGEDNEFEFKEEDVEEDVIDSDFDIDENEDPGQEGQNDEDEESRQRRRAKRGGVFTKAYKEPLPKKSGGGETTSKEKVVKAEPAAGTTSSASDFINKEFNKVENKSFRDSTAKKREEQEKRQKEREVQRQKLAKKTAQQEELQQQQQQPEYRRLTQEELLAEAKITEKINLASLDAYQKLELEKRKKVAIKNVFKGPIIRYHSLSMPLLVDEDDEISQGPNQKQSRNFITFTDEQVLRDIFPAKQQKPVFNPKAKVCAITGLPAKYFDPLTKMPYANLHAFKALREMYNTKNAHNMTA